MAKMTGTITVTKGSTAVTGSETNFASGKVGHNDSLWVGGGVYLVDSVASDTELTLKQAYEGTSGSGKAYDVIHLTGQTYIEDMDRLLAKLVEKYSGIANSVQTTAIPDGIPKAGADSKIAQAWLPGGYNAGPNEIPQTGPDGKLNQDVIPTSVTAKANGIPQADSTGKIDDEWLKGKTIKGFYIHNTPFPPEACLDYCTRKSIVMWDDTLNIDWTPGNLILLSIQCNNGDIYYSYQMTAGNLLLLPTGFYWIVHSKDVAIINGGALSKGDGVVHANPFPGYKVFCKIFFNETTGGTTSWYSPGFFYTYYTSTRGNETWGCNVSQVNFDILKVICGRNGLCTTADLSGAGLSPGDLETVTHYKIVVQKLNSKSGE